MVVKCFSKSNEGPTETGSWCCPPVAGQANPKPDQPTQSEECTWRGMAPFCKGRCESGEIKRAVIDDSDDPYARTHPEFGADELVRC